MVIIVIDIQNLLMSRGHVLTKKKKGSLLFLTTIGYNDENCGRKCCELNLRLVSLLRGVSWGPWGGQLRFGELYNTALVDMSYILVEIKWLQLGEHHGPHQW